MHIPVATYRLQLNPKFTFADVTEIIQYLSSLGISDIYASPILKPKRESPHGYDIVDPHQINPDLGGEEGFNKTIAELKKNGMFWLQDIVPNHMSYDKDNEMLMDVFEQKENSRFFSYFDIDWVHPYESFQGMVLAPFLGSFYSEALEKREIQIVLEPNGLFVQYYDLKFPLLLSTYKDVLLHNVERSEEKYGFSNQTFINFIGIVDLFGRVNSTIDNAQYDQLQHVKKMLWQIYSHDIDIKSFVDENINFLNGKDGDPESLEYLDHLLSKQCYRLSFWKVASEELNYRRFFTINEIISLKVEKDEVFQFSHQLIFRLAKEGKINGLRVDHVDGLYDPSGYLEKLRKEMGDIYVVVEKILGLQEMLPEWWPVHGTTGYDFMNHLNRLFCDEHNDKKLIKIYCKFTKIMMSYDKVVANKKRLIVGKHMAGDVDNLAHLMKKVVARHRFGRDITLYGLKRALVEVVTFFPVYRTYISQHYCDEKDKEYITEAIEKVRGLNPGLEYEINFIKQFLLLELIEELTGEEKTEFWHFVMKFQQLTPSIMAKGSEDTAFYSYNKLLSLNEVGGNPGLPGIEPWDFFKFLKNRSCRTPYSFNATATHDTKRGEDVRARINVLSEIPDIWKTYLAQWSTVNKTKKQKVGDMYEPDANDEYFIYQTLLGSFPSNMDEYDSFKQRIKDYVIKAVREAKVHTAWSKPDPAYERACVSFAEKLLDQKTENKFLQSFQKLQRKIAHHGVFNSLSQTIIKMTAPGVPDFYQGTELWDLSLVDPDNRRPVDYNIRKKYLQYIQDKIPHDILPLVDELLKAKDDGRIKLFLIYQVLQFRKKHNHLFSGGDLVSLKVEGECSESVLAYARKFNNSWAITVAPRFSTRIIGGTEFPLGKDLWKNTHIQLADSMPTDFVDAITLQKLQCCNKVFIGEILSHFPVALLFN